MMSISRTFLLLTCLLAAAALSSCSQLGRSSKAIVIEDGRSMRYENGRAEKLSKKRSSNVYKSRSKRRPARRRR